MDLILALDQMKQFHGVKFAQTRNQLKYHPL